ncbi:MAG: c-type cytochrome [Bradyrhizobiaceae bacterium]|nr:MAG: c-type cytochrome [Bradyrhizobiaceae bacterium]
MTALAAASVLHGVADAWSANPDVGRGRRVFGACAVCHSLDPNRSMTGPSLRGLWNRKAGSLASFPRYSDALKSSNIVWNDKTLDEWIKDPQHLVPGNEMTFPGLRDNQQRKDLLAFLEQATQAGHAPPQMGGMMGGGGDVDLKTVGQEQRVRAVTYCHDTFRVTTADGHTRTFWERNLRLKVDGSKDGPERGTPALMGAGMMGDRADVIFATPDEISGFIKSEC